MIELLELKIGQPGRDRFSSDFDSADKGHHDDDEHHHMSSMDHEMFDILNKKR